MKHIPVMLEEAIAYLNIKADGVYVDCTLGGGGHAEAVLSRLTTGRLIAFDQDPFAVMKARERLQPYADKLTVVEANFAELKVALHARGIEQVDGVLYDLGVSSFHFDDPARGFSYHYDAPLDMRMDTRRQDDARSLVNTASEQDLRHILYRYGEERFAPRIAAEIVKTRQVKPIETTFDLVAVIKKALPQKVLSKVGHPAKQTFQALRIALNDELHVFESSLDQAFDMLAPGGRIVVISFHSLEDRIAKQRFKDRSTVNHPKELLTMPTTTPDFEILHKKVIRPTEQELAVNPRAKSAKLRAICKVTDQ
ncbi:MAG: 16S rRNA (cytosine(1402)-N(4))-methyltransferase RsmH [Acholeplasmatales bacterium]|nr:MAG: 16S rRNA (cytosine(1402)-N(4))-methyltransferase RsmH [Acholeplasmatales bacterium]